MRNSDPGAAKYQSTFKNIVQKKAAVKPKDEPEQPTAEEAQPAKPERKKKA